MGVSLAKVRNLMRITARPISLETRIGEEGESRLVDYSEDKEAVSPHEAVINSPSLPGKIEKLSRR
jgi:DNA-directed RNA polymerase sigma subunit (sigma70/sigma32)